MMYKSMQDLDLLEADLLELEVETFEIEDIVDLEQNAPDGGSTCSSTTSSTCGSGSGGDKAN